MPTKKLIRKILPDNRGSYITEAAVILPVLIIGLCALTMIIRIIGMCEDVCFITAEEVLETDFQANQNKFAVSLCTELEERVSNEVTGDVVVTDFRYLYDSADMSDLIAIEVRTGFNVTNIIGIKGKIEFEEKLLTRGFTGLYRRGDRLSQEDFMSRGRSWEVMIFPKYGIRYHVSGCRYVKDMGEEDPCVTAMQKEDAELRGYTPCRICGGAAVV